MPTRNPETTCETCPYCLTREKTGGKSDGQCLGEPHPVSPRESRRVRVLHGIKMPACRHHPEFFVEETEVKAMPKKSKS